MTGSRTRMAAALMAAKERRETPSDNPLDQWVRDQMDKAGQQDNAARDAVNQDG